MVKPIAIPKTIEELSEFKKWVFTQTIEIQHEKNNLARERRELESERRRLDNQRRSLDRDIKSMKEARNNDRKSRTQDERAFRMKLQILQAEMMKLAKEKDSFKAERANYDRLINLEREGRMDYDAPQVVKGDLFFCGVTDQASLKKRYKDLIKIYHPDNAHGDNGTLLEITKEFEELKLRMPS